MICMHCKKGVNTMFYSLQLGKLVRACAECINTVVKKAVK